MCLGVTCPGVRCPNCNLGVKGPGVICHRRQVSIEDGALSISASLVHVKGVRCQSIFYINCLGVRCLKSIRGQKSGHRCLGVRSTGVKRVPPEMSMAGSAFESQPCSFVKSDIFERYSNEIIFGHPLNQQI